MDRFYLGKLIEDINQDAAVFLEDAFTPHLSHVQALDHKVEIGESHYKVLRFLYALDAQCPSAKFLGARTLMDRLVKKYSGSDYTCQYHFGSDTFVPAEAGGFSIVLQFHLLEDGADHHWNKLAAATQIDEPDTQEPQLPKWLNHADGLAREHMHNEVLSFCQRYVSRDHNHLFHVRDFEAAFWRVVNLACIHHDKDTYEALVAMMPPRFSQQLLAVPGEWHDLRQKEYAFSKEDFNACSRGTLRFCQQLLEL